MESYFEQEKMKGTKVHPPNRSNSEVITLWLFLDQFRFLKFHEGYTVNKLCETNFLTLTARGTSRDFTLKVITPKKKGY